MGKRQRICSLLVLVLFCGAALAGGTIGVFAAEADIDDVPKQLTAPGWEVLPAPKEEPVIVYELNLVELRYEMGRIVEVSVEYSKGEDLEGGYAIITDEAVLRLIGDFPASFTVRSSGEKTSSAAAFEYNAWLVTMGNQPVSIEVMEDTIVAAEEEEETEYGLRITLTPEYYGDPDSGVLTEIDLEYASRENAVGNVRLTDWLSAEKDRPLAVIVRDLNYTKEQARKYFALYASAEVMSPRALADQGPVVSIGSIKGLQELMARPQSQAGTNAELRMAVGVKDAKVGPMGKLLLEREQYKLSAEAEGFPGGVSYRIGGTYYLYEELGLAAHVDKRAGSEALIRCGVADQVQWGDVEVEAVWLPIAYAPDEGRFIGSVWLQCSAALDVNRWRFQYDFTYDSGEIGHELAVMRKASADCAVSLECAQLPTKESLYALGLVFWLE
ncbi:MAG TPA: hypothetical protein GXX47_02645 [Firmicutes bacterium]|nr:hypothetical protein [Bacillota bacterium]